MGTAFDDLDKRMEEAHKDMQKMKEETKAKQEEKKRQKEKAEEDQQKHTIL